MNQTQNFQEIEPVYLPHQALLEASRCLFCHDAPCSQACPAGVDVSGFIRRLKGGNTAGAAQLILEANILGGTCGRICPVEILCQEACRHTELAEPIRIGRLQAYAWEKGLPYVDVPVRKKKPQGKVAVVGAGPAGMAGAAELARMGYQVQIFESAERAGGVLVYGIPAYRLPLEVVARELDLLGRLGVQISCGHGVGRELDLAALQSAGFGAVLLGVGLGLSARVGLPGEDLEGVFWAAELLAKIKADLGSHEDIAVGLGRRAVIIGGGNVAIDVACSIHKLGIPKVELVCLESPPEMPAFPSEIRIALDLGVELHTRCKPLSILGNRQSHVAGLEGIGIEWKKPGLLVPENAVSVPGTEFRLQADSIVEAIGQRPERTIAETFQLQTSPAGLVLADEQTGQTSNPMVFAAGDVTNGGATVVKAVAEGKKAARGIHRYLQQRI